MKNNTYGKFIIISDKNNLAGLAVLLYSLLKNSTLKFHKFYLILSDISQDELKCLVNGLIDFKSSFEIELKSCENINTDLNLHGNKMPMLKLNMLQNINEKRILYLDTDTVIDTDISKLWNLELAGHTIAAVQESTFLRSLDKKFFKKHLPNLDSPYFNSGVMLIDVKKFKKVINFKKYKQFLFQTELNTSDQTLLNFFLLNQVLFLSKKYNFLVHKKTKIPKEDSRKIYHYIGMPKPWHWGFSLISRNARKYNAYNKNIFSNQLFFKDLIILKKFWKSYLRLLFKF